MACVCDSNSLEKRLRQGRNINDENWIQGSISFNQWLKDNADKTAPNITLLDTSAKTIEESCKFVDEWIKARL